MTSGLFALMLPVSKGAIAQEYPGCFMIDSSGQARNLNNLCQPPLQTATPGGQVPGQPGNVPGGEAAAPGQVQTLPDGTTVQILPDGTRVINGTGSAPIQTVPGQPTQGTPTQQQVPTGTQTQQQVPTGTPTQQQVPTGTPTQQQVP
ncbi:T-complex 10 C-terminal domain-containing protein, partial [Laspinema sp. D5]|nr:T-complex 10 C-terminal domain-containing protein [Laspinema sp. D3d]